MNTTEIYIGGIVHFIRYFDCESHEFSTALSKLQLISVYIHTPVGSISHLSMLFGYFFPFFFVVLQNGDLIHFSALYNSVLDLVL